MHFTIVFNSQEACDLSFGLVFIPCPVWMKGGKEIINIHYDNPAFLKGDLKPLLEKEEIEDKTAEGNKSVSVIVHTTGYGTERDLETLVKDLENEDYIVKLVRL